MSLYSTNQLPPLVEAPPSGAAVEAAAAASHSTHHSMETLVVVLAVITILGVVAGIIARLCGGRHLGGSGEHDIEGWVERNCRSCIDAGVATAPPPAKAEPPKQEEVKK
ncbi:uncharacterized protein LOC127265510 [Andrographis paniculata]|uniref:uncharacterized protein LOC127265510 n=1 Tax=Andrographis paniculata TaxID=175694 RepID=UPI0021E705F4|nr:uncharacterized protein LOC127265510 [Andrographis paniculata]